MQPWSICYVISSAAWPKIMNKQIKTNIVTFRQNNIAFCPGTCNVSEFLWFVNLMFFVVHQSTFNTLWNEILPDYI